MWQTQWTRASHGRDAVTSQVVDLEKGTKTVSDAGGGWRALVPKSKVTMALIALLVLLVVAWALMR